jgi:catechol 2,3-dioxygenase-like lactoylglutathione lyase family enzyme
MLSCTHLVLYAKELSATYNFTYNFYVQLLELPERRYAPAEDFLSVAAGDFILNFYGPKLHGPLEAGYSQGVGHLGLDAFTRSVVEENFSRLLGTTFPPLASSMQPLETLHELRSRQTSGPYRFYVLDPDGYTVEIHTWEGVDEDV